MEQKTVEQIAAEKYPYWVKKADNNNDLAEIDRHNRNATLQRLSFIDGFTTAQQSQPMWREIEVDVTKLEKQTIYHGGYKDGYTHYLSSEDLLKLPTHTKTTPQERGER